MKGKDGGAAKVLRREWALRRLPRWGRGVRRRVAPLRTEMPLRDIPVLRMAYFTIKPHRGLISKTLMLQVRCANPTGNFAPKRPFGTFWCFGRLIFRKSSSAFSPKRSTFRFASLSLRCRTEMFFQNIPVLRSAYFPKKLFSFFSKTLDLQVRFALPPMGGGSFAPPCTPLSCPCRTDLSSVQKTPHLFSDGQTGCSSARTLLFPLPG